MPGRGVIEGRVSGSSVFFLKWMPVYHVRWEGKLMTFSEYLLREFDLPLDEQVPHPPIKYTGEYRPPEDELAGTWEFACTTTEVVSRGSHSRTKSPRAAVRGRLGGPRNPELAV
jgi:hypothetical protein